MVLNLADLDGTPLHFVPNTGAKVDVSCVNCTRASHVSF